MLVTGAVTGGRASAGAGVCGIGTVGAAGSLAAGGVASKLNPACGSGAFLVYVFDYLLAENKRVASILGNNLFSSEDYIRDILKNNIYGVDLNEESVEITKLSLWLKSAQKGKKLTTLDNNIKSGNSLISDHGIGTNKAFNWQSEFNDIFSNGGFVWR